MLVTWQIMKKFCVFPWYVFSIGKRNEIFMCVK